MQQEVDDAERKAKENKEKIAHIEQDINDTMEGVMEEIKAAICYRNIYVPFILKYE